MLPHRVSPAVLAILALIACEDPERPATTRPSIARPSYALASTGLPAEILGALPGTTRSFAEAINDAGVIVGWADVSQGCCVLTHAVIWNGGVPTALTNPPDAGLSQAFDINGNGTIVGHASGGSITVERAGVVWQNGVPTVLPSPNGIPASTLKGINDAGTIVGFSYDPATTDVCRDQRAVVWQNGQPSVLPLPASTQWSCSGAEDINTQGVIAGSARDQLGLDHALVWQGGQPTELAPLVPGQSAIARVVNDNGMVAGFAIDVVNGVGTAVAVRWQSPSSQPTKLSVPTDARSCDGQAINNAGDVAGYCFMNDFSYHAMAWTGGQVIDLGLLPGSNQSTVTAMNNGGVMVGFDGTPPGIRAVAWGLNAAPVVGPVTAAPDLLAVNASTVVSAPFTDPNAGDTHTGVIAWGDGMTSAAAITESGGSGTASASHSYIAVGVYTVKVTVTDNHSASGSATYEYVVVYDPNGGFVTGGGWINSQAGAYAADPAAGGRASFGFVSKYKPGTSTPTGNTEFQFQAGGLNFRSASYDWLIVSGARAQFKGLGTVNGAGSYGFLLTAIDGQLPGGGGADKFRIKIWDKATGAAVYDNQSGTTDDAAPTTALGGGSIVIHQ